MRAESLEGAVLAALQAAQHRRQARPAAKGHGVLAERIVRLRSAGGLDRRFVLSYEPDPDEAGAVVFRIRPASAKALEAPAPALAMLTTQAAADLLNVSRPYVVKLVEEGVFEGVERTRAGHRRIPAAEVDRVRENMRASRRAALDQMEVLASDLRQRELDAARVASRRRWVKPAG
jgi:excisionase family DNA binding protein